MPYERSNELIIPAGTNAALLVKPTCDEWFQFYVKTLLQPLLNKINS